MSNVILRPVAPSDDMHTVAKLILETDPYIYLDLFGSLEGAERVLTILFERDEGIFKRSCYYVAELEGQLVGVAGLFLTDDIWDEEDIKMAFREADVPLPESFYAVSEYFKSVHNYQPGTKACNVCVSKNFRGKGIGGDIIRQLLRIAGNVNVSLTVLADNHIAIKLYERHGFRMMFDYMDYGGYQRPKVRCYSMIRPSSMY